ALVVLEITPGPDMMLVLARGIGQGRQTALMAVIGMVLVSGFIQVGLLVLGVASLLQAYPGGVVLLRWAGGLYLLYLGLRMLWASMGARGHMPAVAGISPRQALREGTINNLTNPKSFLFMFAFVPQFVSPETGPVWLQLLVLGTLQKCSGMLSLGSVALASGTVGRWLERWPSLLAWQCCFSGLVMIGLGLRLVLSRR